MKTISTRTILGRFRIIAFAEGISFLLLLFIAMPLKYMFDLPLAVKIVGWIHGILFLLYMLLLLQVKTEKSWSMKKAALAVLAALLPFGPFVFDKKVVAQH